VFSYIIVIISASHMLSEILNFYLRNAPGFLATFTARSNTLPRMVYSIKLAPARFMGEAGIRLEKRKNDYP